MVVAEVADVAMYTELAHPHFLLISNRWCWLHQVLFDVIAHRCMILKFILLGSFTFPFPTTFPVEAMMAEAVACSAVLTVCCRPEKLAALARAIAVSVN
jgi:hypothetical protein